MSGTTAFGVLMIGAALWYAALMRRHAARLRRSRARLEAMGPHEIAASLRPSGGHVEPSPQRAPITTNGRRD